MRLYADRVSCENVDPDPVAVPISRPLPLAEELRRLVRVELSRRAADDGEESFEEADDFDEDDDELEFVTKYTVRDMAPDGPDQVDAAPPRDPRKKEEKNASAVEASPSEVDQAEK